MTCTAAHHQGAICVGTSLVSSDRTPADRFWISVSEHVTCSETSESRVEVDRGD